MSDADVTSDSCEFGIFMPRPIQPAVLVTVEMVYNPLDLVEQNALEFLIPGDLDTYIDLDMKFYVRGKLVWERCRSDRHYCREQ